MNKKENGKMKINEIMREWKKEKWTENASKYKRKYQKEYKNKKKIAEKNEK